MRRIPRPTNEETVKLLRSAVDQIERKIAYDVQPILEAADAIEEEIAVSRNHTEKVIAENRARVGKYYAKRDPFGADDTHAFVKDHYMTTYHAVTSCGTDGFELRGWSFSRSPRGRVTITNNVFSGWDDGDEITADEFYAAARDILDLVKPLLSSPLPF